jgi:hypothetical protein
VHYAEHMRCLLPCALSCALGACASSDPIDDSDGLKKADDVIFVTGWELPQGPGTGTARLDLSFGWETRGWPAEGMHAQLIFNHFVGTLGQPKNCGDCPQAIEHARIVAGMGETCPGDGCVVVQFPFIPVTSAPGTVVDCTKDFEEVLIQGPHEEHKSVHIGAQKCSYRLDSTATAVGQTVKISELNATFLGECDQPLPPGHPITCGGDNFKLTNGQFEVELRNLD